MENTLTSRQLNHHPSKHCSATELQRYLDVQLKFSKISNFDVLLFMIHCEFESEIVHIT